MYTHTHLLNSYSHLLKHTPLPKHGRAHAKSLLLVAIGIGFQHPDASTLRSDITAQSRSVLRPARPHTIGILITHLPTQQGLVSHLRSVWITSTYAPCKLP